MSAEIVEWTREALLASNEEQAAFTAEATARLEQRRAKIGSYLDQAYQDRLEGRITVEFWERKTNKLEQERSSINAQLEAHERASSSYFREGVPQLAYKLYVSQQPREQRKILDVVVSNCRLNGRTIDYDYRKPFDLIADVTQREVWRGGRDLNPRPPA